MLNVSVVSADQQVWAGEAEMVVARTTEGEIGILTGHTPLLAVLSAGEVRVTQPGGRKIIANAQDGFISVQDDTVTVVAGAAELVS
ncbi:MAG TPA: F0F1 ATP synthase subunit epsilon [Naasia sp.]